MWSNPWGGGLGELLDGGRPAQTQVAHDRDRLQMRDEDRDRIDPRAHFSWEGRDRRVLKRQCGSARPGVGTSAAVTRRLELSDEEDIQSEQADEADEAFAIGSSNAGESQRENRERSPPGFLSVS